MEEYLGVYKALVTETDCFRDTGKIKTRISIMNNMYVDKDIRDNYDASEFKQGLEKDMYTQVFLPFGGGYDYGMFKLPPVNSLGLVSFIDGNPNNPIWLGGISSNIYTKTGAFSSSSLPSDNAFSGKSIITFNNDKGVSEINSEDINSLVIKTKNNTFKDINNEEEINWEKRKVENAIILSENKLEIAHADNENTEYQRILFKREEGDEDTYSIKIGDERSGSDTSTIKIGESGIKLEVLKSDSISVVDIGDTEIIISMKKGTTETEVRQTEKEIRLTNDKSSVILKKENVRDEVVITSQRVRINAEDVLLGNGDFRVVVSPSSFNISLEDGTMLTTAKNVRL